MQEHEAVQSLNKTANLITYLLHGGKSFLRSNPVIGQDIPRKLRIIMTLKRQPRNRKVQYDVMTSDKTKNNQN